MQKFNNDFFSKINKIINEKNIVNKFAILIDMNDKMSIKTDQEVSCESDSKNNLKKKDNINTDVDKDLKILKEKENIKIKKDDKYKIRKSINQKIMKMKRIE